MADLQKAADQALAAQFFAAIGDNDVAVMQALMSSGAEIDGAYKGATPLMHAARNDKAAAVALLVDKGADIALENADGEDAKCVAAGAGHRKVVNLITKTAQQRDERIAAQREAEAFLRNLEDIVNAVKGGTDMAVRVKPPLRLKGSCHG